MIYKYSDCSGLKTIFYNAKKCENKTADSNVFIYIYGIQNIIIGKDVEKVPNYLFYYLDNAPTRVISQSVTPPTCGENTFNFDPYTVKLYVPNGAESNYPNPTAGWWRYFTIVTVDKPLTSIALSDSEATIDLGSTKQLTATAAPSDATIADIFEWSSSNPEVAVVDGNGLVSAVGEGTTVITAKALDGSNLEATCVVTVYPVAENVNQLKPGTNRVNFGLQGVKMHDGVLYACTTAKSVNESTPTFHSNDAGNMAPYEDRNFAAFDQRDWVAISCLEGEFEGKELSYPFVAQFADGMLTPSETINTKAHASAYKLNTFRAENILHGGYSNYAERDYKAYYVPARVNEVAKFMGLIETVGGVKYLYSNNAYGRKEGEGIKIEGSIADNSESYSLLEGILVADASTKAGVKIIMLQDLGEATGVEGVDTAAARIYTANGNIIIAATEDGEAAVYDFTGRLIKSVPVASGNSTAVPVAPGCYIVKTGTKTQSVIVK